jgi:hypothetical protein
VWLAAELASGERVAVKVRREGAAGSGTAGSGTARLAREIALLRRIDHPHVVRLRRVVDLPDGGRALVMDLAAGGSLGDLVAARGPLDPGEACTAIVPVARTLAELHARGLVHGDLSPGNILFTADGRPLVADLGCAVVLGERSTEIWGSDGYTDPERVGVADPAHDVFALGAVLRFALTGGPGKGVDAGGRSDDPRVRTLLALADACTVAVLGDRPAPEEIAGKALATVSPAPVRLLRPLEDSGGGPAGVGGGGVPASPGGSGAGGPSRPMTRVRLSAADRGWTRPPSPPGPDGGLSSQPTAATGLPMTSLDLGLGSTTPRRGGEVGARSGDVVSAVRTRRRTPVSSRTDVSAAEVTSGTPRRRTPRRRTPRRWGAIPRRRGGGAGTGTGTGPTGQGPRRQKRTGELPGGGARITGWVALVCVGVVVGVGLLLGVLTAPELSGAEPQTASQAAGLPRESAASAAVSAAVSAAASAAVSAAVSAAASAAGAPSTTVGREAVSVAVRRLAEGRADAFTTGSVGPLALVDEPGSPAMAADSALVGRLTGLGLRLDGLSYQVAGERLVPGPGDKVVVDATVVTSAHRQVTVPGGAVRASVPASSRSVSLTLVPAADGRHWLVRSVTSRS